MLVVTERPGHGLTLVEAGLRPRIGARLAARRLDAALACGVEPESGLGLAIRAHALTRPGVRRYLARCLERLVTEVARPAGLRPNPLTAGRRRAVREATDDLHELIARLRGSGPVSARGVAQVAVLLSDGAGPLHLGLTEPDLGAAVRQALAHLDAPVMPSRRPG